MDLQKTAFSCHRGSFVIRGLEYKRNQHNRIPVIMSHGFLSNQNIMKPYAKALAQEGYVVFTYDFCGGAMFGKSGGKFRDMSITTEREDLKSVIAHVEQLSYVDPAKLILLGASQGGFVSSLVAAEYGAKIDRLILLYPALCIPDDARKGKMLMIHFDPEHIRETIKSGPFHFSPNYPESVLGIDIYVELQKIQIPLLILHGDADPIVDLRYVQRAMDAAVNPSSRLAVMEKAGHGFKRAQRKVATGHIIAFLKDTSI